MPCAEYNKFLNSIDVFYNISQCLLSSDIRLLFDLRYIICYYVITMNFHCDNSY